MENRLDLRRVVFKLDVLLASGSADRDPRAAECIALVLKEGKTERRKDGKKERRKEGRTEKDKRGMHLRRDLQGAELKKQKQNVDFHRAGLCDVVRLHVLLVHGKHEHGP